MTSLPMRSNLMTASRPFRVIEVALQVLAEQVNRQI
jgi:hypothetical protein